MIDVEAALRQAPEKGWGVVRCSRWTAVACWVLGYAKVQIAGNAPDTYQMRVIGAGRLFLRSQDALRTDV